jgi:hypothetical protein
VNLDLRQTKLLTEFLGPLPDEITGEELFARLLGRLDTERGPDPVMYRAKEPIKVSPGAPAITIGIPTRGFPPVEFFISLLQLLHPLNTAMSYTVQKGKLPAAARNAILETALAENIETVCFLDDDVLFPDTTLYRLWGAMRKHPEAAVITGVYSTKIEPVEPLLYLDAEAGAFWDWPLGALIPIHSAGAGCMLVNMAYVRKLKGPWFDDVLKDSTPDDVGGKTRNRWGHDRFFMMRMRDEAGGVIYADTGLLLSHFDTQLNRNYVLPGDSPCFQRPPVGESWVPALTAAGVVYWRRILPQAHSDGTFLGYLDWLRGPGQQETTTALLGVSS